jgi:hypothetical protein
MEGRVSDRNVQHVRGGYGVSGLERTAKDSVGDGWAFLISDIDCASIHPSYRIAVVRSSVNILTPDPMTPDA